jgi:phasin family protein
MFSNPEHFSNATKALFESQLAIFNALTSKAVESVEKVVALNIAAVKASAEESFAAVHQLSQAKDPQSFIELSSAQAKANAEKAASYGRHFTEIASGLQAEFTKVAERQLDETKQKVNALVEDVTKNAPAGSESAINMLKSAISNANAGFEQMSKVTKQAVETVEAQVAKATDQFNQAVEKNTGKVSKK